MRKIWNNRNLISTFAINDLMIRYRNSILGFFWSILEPLLMLSVIYVVFTHLFKSQIENYPLYLLLGLIMWNFFTRSTSMSLMSLIGRGGIVSKIYFPREILPISACITAFIMLVLELGILGVFMIVFQFVPPITIFILPIILVLEFILALGVSFILSVSNARYRDIQNIWNIITYAGFFLTPVIYQLEVFPDNIRSILSLNPLAHILTMGHNATLFDKSPDLYLLLAIVVFSISLLTIGYFIFKKYVSKVVEEL